MLARFGLFFGMLAVLVVPALAIALAAHAVSARRRRALGIRRVAGLLFRPDLFYAPGHTWLHRRNGGVLELGIDDLAQRLLPSVTAVELPRPGTTVARGETIAVLHGGGRAVRIPAPIAGTIAGVNASVLRDPALVKRDGYGRGWLVAMAPADPSFADLPQRRAGGGVAPARVRPLEPLRRGAARLRGRGRRRARRARALARRRGGLEGAHGRVPRSRSS